MFSPKTGPFGAKKNIEAAADSLLALDENAPVDNVEGGEVAVEDPGHFDYAQNVAHVCLQHQNKKKWKLAWTCNGPFWQITGPFP
jgi:hypothetical protein